MVMLTWRDLVRPGQCAHVGRSLYSAGRWSRLHLHDFCEVFWIEAGSGEHECGADHHALEMGDLVFIRRPDLHRFRSSSSMAIVNVAVSAELIESLNVRHRLDRAGLWQADGAPSRYRLDGQRCAALSRAAADLARSPLTAMHAEAFILGLCCTVLDDPGARSGMPAWLATACRRLREPAHLAIGVAAFTGLCGRHGDHAGRELRRWTGRSPGELVRELRLEGAAADLARDDAPVADIAAAHGFAGLANFFVQFRRRYGCTPAAWRRRARTPF